MNFTRRKLIRFHHCDPAGIVFYPQFFYLLHEIQEDFLAHIGFPEHALIGSGTGVPVVDLKVEFKGMCRHGDEVEITLRLSKIGNSSMGMEYEIEDGGKLKLRARAVVVYSTVPDGKPVRIPDDLRNALLPYLDADVHEAV
jgi:4-hydroxybenzoyl-CoA thioesterase